MLNIEQITCWQTEDGVIHTSEKDAKTAAVSRRLMQLLSKSEIDWDLNAPSDVVEFLVNNAEPLRALLKELQDAPA